MKTYKIVNALAGSGQIEVAYYYDGAAVGTYAVDVPVKDGAFLVGAELDAEIMGRYPDWLLTRKQQVATAAGFETIQALAEAKASVAVTLSDAKEAAKQKVNAHREKIMSAGVAFMGHQFDSDDLSVTRLTAVATAVAAGATLPPGFAWRSAANVDVQMSGASVVGLLATMISRANEVHTASWAVKQQIDAASTVEAVNAVQWVDVTAGSM